MRNVIRSILAVLAGLAAAVVIFTVFEAVNSRLFPLPAGVNPADPESLRAAAQSIPAGAFILVLAGWAIGSLAGAWLAGRIAGRAPLAHGMVVAVLLLLAGVGNMLLIPHPVWVWIIGIATFLGGGYAGARLAARTAPAAAR